MNLHDKIEQLRQQPEHVRLRTATLLTAVSGVVLVALWLVVLLPLQLKFTNPSNKVKPTATPEQARTTQNILALPASVLPQQGVVSGAQSWQQDSSSGALPGSNVVEASPLSSVEPIDSPSPTITPSASPTPSPLIIENDSTIVAPSPVVSSRPVQITH